MQKMSGFRNRIRVSEIFESIQGEGRWVGVPMLFIRLSGCNKSCDWCDSKYHIEGREYDVENLVKRILKSKLKFICWTGGEPLLQKYLIYKVIGSTCSRYHHLETNGTLLEDFDLDVFDYVVISPKDVAVAKRVSKFVNENMDIKVVTDLKTVGVKLIPYATMLMPLTVDYGALDNEIKRKVWKYCVSKGLKFSPRIQVDLFGRKRGK
jgi:organic radical activating enzyme